MNFSKYIFTLFNSFKKQILKLLLVMQIFIYINLLKNDQIQTLKEIFENEKISKIGIDLSKTYILLKQEGIHLKGIKFDSNIAAYILNPTNNKLKIENLA